MIVGYRVKLEQHTEILNVDKFFKISESNSYCGLAGGGPKIDRGSIVCDNLLWGQLTNTLFK